MVRHSHSRLESYSSYTSGNELDLAMQRSPLIEDEGEKTRWDDADSAYNSDSNRNNWVQMSPSSTLDSYAEEDGEELKGAMNEKQQMLLFPAEKSKTFVAFGYVLVALAVNTISIALTHDRLPDRELVPPLPDSVLDSLAEYPQVLYLPDIVVISALLIGLVLLLSHHHRWIIARRLFFILGTLYLMRAVTMYVTVLPVPNRVVKCDPKMNSTSASVIFKRVWDTAVGGGLRISGKKNTCGDYIFSGHTVILVTSYYMVREYAPKRLWILRWISCVLAWGGMGAILVSRRHYTVDVLIGYYAATRLFWAYHMLANNTQFKVNSKHNPWRDAWWWGIFQYLESSINAPLMHRYSFPFAISRMHRIQNNFS